MCYPTLQTLNTANFYRDGGQKLLIQNWACLENVYDGDSGSDGSITIRDVRSAAQKG